MSRRRRPIATPLLLCSVAGASLVGMASGASAGPLGTAGITARTASRPATLLAATPPTRPVFDSPAVVDDYRPGFEPDVAVDKSPGANGQRIYTSTPFGFSTTQSFIERSDDGAATFHNIAGQVFGKPLTCVGGGDTELQIDPSNGHLFFVDLQGLTEYSTARSDDHGSTFTPSCAAVTGTGVDRQWVGLDTNGGKSAVTPAATDGRAYLDYDNVLQADGANQLVINQSGDGVQYGSVCAPGATVLSDGVCAVPATVISPDEGLPGNLLVDDTPAGAHEHSVYAVHTNGALSHMVVSVCRGAAAGTSPLNAAAAANYCTDPTAITPGDLNRVSTHWTDVVIDPAATGVVDKAFPVIALDSTGGLYATWASAPTGAAGQTAPAQIFLAHSTDGGATWSTPVRVNDPTTQVTNIFPWIVAGDHGRVDIAWYTSRNSTGSVPYDSDSLANGLWNVELAQSLNAASAAPSFTRTQVSDHPVKYGSISTGGLGGAADRSLGDFMQVTSTAQGAAVVSYVDDTSEGRNQDITEGSGQTVSEASGPTMIARQLGGPSLFTKTGNLGAASPAVGSVADPTGDGFLAEAGQTIPGSAAEDITGVSVSQPDSGHLRFTMKTADPALAADLLTPPAVSAAAGSTTGVWMVRWSDRYEPALLDGAIRYVAMQSTAGGTPMFYTGSTRCIATTRCKYFNYPTTTPVAGTITGSTITWTVALADIGSPVAGSGLWSVTGSTNVQPAPSTASTPTLPTTGTITNSQIPQRIDAARSFSFIVTQSPPVATPEIGTPALLVGVAGVGGGLVLLRGRRRRATA